MIAGGKLSQTCCNTAYGYERAAAGQGSPGHCCSALKSDWKNGTFLFNRSAPCVLSPVSAYFTDKNKVFLSAFTTLMDTA